MDGDVDGFYVAFLYRIRFGVCFCCIRQHMNARMIYLYFFCRCWYHFGWHHAFISRMSTLNQHISGSPIPHHPVLGFFVLLHPLSATHVPKEQSKHTQRYLLAYVTNSMCECIIKDHWRKKNYNKKNRQRTTTNGELFSSSTFDLIIYFCVVEKFWVCTDLDFGEGGCEGSRWIISLLPFRCSAPLTHS